MVISRRGFIAGSAAALAGCSQDPQMLDYDGPAVTSLLVRKNARMLHLFSGPQQIGYFRFELGFAPVGAKQVRGDGRTPEGIYRIDRRNPNSAYHLSLGISYPNRQDRAFAHEQGHSPGGDIFIHGTPRELEGQPDWTAGCLAVRNGEIEQLFSMIQVGTPIVLRA
ncbi:MAG: L,D-transpeptidase family protein [Rhodobacteraceae bacterium]|nr:L,D-transpeptidase family protein [Paracoccaceae bacterium]